jgi:hypothetical protein
LDFWFEKWHLATLLEIEMFSQSAHIDFYCWFVNQSRMNDAAVVSGAGLPDFSWYNVPTPYTKFTQTIPNVHKIFQMAVKYTKCQ